MPANKRRKPNSRGEAGQITSYQIRANLYPQFQRDAEVLQYLRECVRPGGVSRWIADACYEKMLRERQQNNLQQTLAPSPVHEQGPMDELDEAARALGI